ncbi:flagellar biosynthesis repressor FlbT [Maricaulis sp.]|uniref:flagellar biosynthesis repressor FlbT n=1 Tax=Maricaulis sp. TaxID=1486257 RepID=UPI003A92C2C5
MALKISLKPGEKFVLNGAVVENGDRRATLLLQNRASVLREKDIMQASEVTTPARHIYFPIMMMYLSDQADEHQYEQFVLRMNEFMGAISAPDVLTSCVTISRDVMAGEYYKALMRCKKLIAFEEERLR